MASSLSVKSNGFDTMGFSFPMLRRLLDIQLDYTFHLYKENNCQSFKFDLIIEAVQSQRKKNRIGGKTLQMLTLPHRCPAQYI